MDKRKLVNSLASLTANLSPYDHRDTNALKTLRSALASWLAKGDPGTTYTEQVQSVAEPVVPEALEKELAGLFDSNLQAEHAPGTGTRVIRRSLLSAQVLGDNHKPEWLQGRAPAYSLGPFIDDMGMPSWFDFFAPKLLQFAAFKSDVLPFLKFEYADFLPAGAIHNINLGPGSVWIRASYLTSLAPANAYVGLKISSGHLSFDSNITITDNNLVLEDNASCELSLELAPAAPIANAPIEAGKDAAAAKAILPASLVIRFSFNNGSFTQVGNSSLELYDNNYQFTWLQVAPLYLIKLQRIAFPLQSATTQLNINQVRSTLFRTKGRAAVDLSAWSLPLTFEDHNKLGEAAGNGAFLLHATGDLAADFMKPGGDSIQLGETFWIAEPAKITLYAFEAKAANVFQRYNLWWEDGAPKRSGVVVQLLKSASLVYTCSALDETESILTTVNLAGSFDKPVTSDGKRLKANFTDARYYLLQYKQDTYIACYANQQLKKLLQQQLFDELAPLSFALSNAFAKVTPADSFTLTGHVTDGDSVDKGACRFQSGLYSLLPIFPDPYVSNLEIIPGRQEHLYAHDYLQTSLLASVNWTDIADPQLQFQLLPQGNKLFNKTDSNRQGIYERLKNKSSQHSISYAMQVPDENGKVTEQEISAGKLIDEDASREEWMKRTFSHSSGGAQFPSFFLLDVSGNIDQFGVGVGPESKLEFEGIELVAGANNLHVFTLPPIQWEAISTVQNPDVLPSPFPSPASSLDTGDPALLSQVPSFKLLPVTAQAAIANILADFNDVNAANVPAMAAWVNLPFGMKSMLQLQQHKAAIHNNQPHFKQPALAGATQVSLAALTTAAANNESRGFEGVTIQTRNLVDESRNALGLSVLGFVVDTVFNNEFGPSSPDKRVPLCRIDISGYGASAFSNWLNSDAQIAATSQARFDVMIGRTAHEVVQIKSILYCCGASVVRTITIQRKANGTVTRHDSGWVAEGPGLFDFSYKLKGVAVANPYLFHLGPVKAFYQITNIRDTLRVVQVPPLEAGDETASLQEVIFDANIQVENVARGKVNGYVPSKGQKGFVQLAPRGKPLSASQLSYLLTKEGSIGGPVDCVINIAGSQQELRVTRVDTNKMYGSTVFANAARGTFVLPNDGAWTTVAQKDNQISGLGSNSGVPLMSMNASNIYELREPSDDPKNAIGLVHGSSSHRTLFLRPVIQVGTDFISTQQPLFADFYALADTQNIFPDLNKTFPVGAGNGSLKIHGPGQLQLTSPGEVNVSTTPRMLRTDANLTSYVEYFDKGKTSEISIVIDPNSAKKWETGMKAYKLVYDVQGQKRVKLFHMNFYASGTDAPKIDKTVSEYGGFLGSIQDMLQFFGKTDLGEAETEFSNYNFLNSAERKWKTGLSVSITFYTYKMFPFHYGKVQVGPMKGVEFPKKWDEFQKSDGSKLPAWEELAGGPLPELAWFKGKIGFMIFEKTEHGASKGGFNLKIAADMGVMATSFLEVAACYAIGVVECSIDFVDDKAKAISFKVAMGFQGKIKISELVEAEGSRTIGTEYDSDKKVFYAVISQELRFTVATLGGAATVEGKAPLRIADMLDDPLKTTKETLAQFDLTVTVELTAAYVLNFEQSYTWQELIRIM